MPIHLIGGDAGGPPFRRAFFSTILGEILAKSGDPNGFTLTLLLADGTSLDVCSIEDLTDDYLSVRCYQSDDSCGLGLDLVPYGMIYRVQLTPKGKEDGERVGFKWVQPSQNKS